MKLLERVGAEDVLGLAGVALVAVGLWPIYRPLVPLWLGGCCLLLCWLSNKKSEGA